MAAIMLWMSDTLARVRIRIIAGDVKVSDHGYDEIRNDELTVEQLVQGIEVAEIIEDYPDYPKGPCVLVLQEDEIGEPVHVLWGIPRGHGGPAVLITAYRPDPRLWSEDFKTREP